MGVMTRVFDVMFGDGRNLIRETAGVFVENKEAGADRAAQMQRAALEQFGAEFALPRKGVFDRVVDGLNRLPRPGLALGTLGLFITAMVNPVWFSARMEGLALVPDPLWWLLGAIVSFYFGARHQAKGQEFQERLIHGIAQRSATPAPSEEEEDPNPALENWRDRRLAPQY
ncbi:MAG: holin family protein [Thalassovita sp.]